MIISTILSVLSFLFIILFLIFSDVYIHETKNSLFYFFNNVFPIIFPFYVLSSMIVSGNLPNIITKKFKNFFPKTFHLPSCSIIALTAGLISGYPLGAKIAVDLKNSGNITKDDAALICSFSNNIGPIFAILVVGKKYLGNPLEGLKIWFYITISSLVLGYIFCKTSKRYCSNINISPFAYTTKKINISDAILNGLNTALYVGAVIVFFSSLTVFIKIIPNVTNFHESIFHAFMELTGGLNKLNLFISNCSLKKIILCFLCCWSGFSSHIQVCGIIQTNKISCKYYILMKITQPALAICLLYLF